VLIEHDNGNYGRRDSDLALFRIFDVKPQCQRDVAFWKIPIEDSYIRHMNRKLRLITRRMAPHEKRRKEKREQFGYSWAILLLLTHFDNKALLCFTSTFSQRALAAFLKQCSQSDA
jgi:hypothetical protein